MAAMAKNIGCRLRTIVLQGMQRGTTGVNVPNKLVEFVAMIACLKGFTKQYGNPLLHNCPVLCIFVDYLWSFSQQLLGAAISADTDFIAETTISNKMITSADAERKILKEELARLPHTYAQWLVTSDYVSASQSERLLKACIHMLEPWDQALQEPSFMKIQNAMTEISISVRQLQVGLTVSRVQEGPDPPRHENARTSDSEDEMSSDDR